MDLRLFYFYVTKYSKKTFKHQAFSELFSTAKSRQVMLMKKPLYSCDDNQVSFLPTGHLQPESQ